MTMHKNPARLHARIRPGRFSSVLQRFAAWPPHLRKLRAETAECLCPDPDQPMANLCSPPLHEMLPATSIYGREHACSTDGRNSFYDMPGFTGGPPCRTHVPPNQTFSQVHFLRIEGLATSAKTNSAMTPSSAIARRRLYFATNCEGCWGRKACKHKGSATHFEDLRSDQNATSCNQPQEPKFAGT